MRAARVPCCRWRAHWLPHGARTSEGAGHRGQRGGKLRARIGTPLGLHYRGQRILRTDDPDAAHPAPHWPRAPCHCSIQVNTLVPGAINTPFLDVMLANPRKLACILGRIPLGKQGEGQCMPTCCLH